MTCGGDQIIAAMLQEVAQVFAPMRLDKAKQVFERATIANFLDFMRHDGSLAAAKSLIELWCLQWSVAASIPTGRRPSGRGSALSNRRHERTPVRSRRPAKDRETCGWCYSPPSKTAPKNAEISDGFNDPAFAERGMKKAGELSANRWDFIGGRGAGSEGNPVKSG
jgi:hypothetical protein